MKQLTQFDSTDNFRALIRQDLRDLGIKVPKGKKSKRFNTKTQEKQDDKIFGNYLSHVSCVHEEDCGYVPRFLVDAADIIKKNIEQEGLFRKSGSVSRQKELQQHIEEGKGLADSNVFDITSLIKQFFRMLPEPLFTSTYHDTFIKCFQLSSTEDSQSAVLLLCLLLPGEHLCTLRFMMKLLADIASHSDKNKMDPANLAVVLAPNMMHINNKSEKMNSSEEKLLQVQTSVVELLIRNADHIGMISDSLQERAILMTEVFGTDDELDMTEDTMEESRDCRKKEKKRKRSGSFQGLVSSITQSITKWRKSTDGKAGNLSHASNMSQTSAFSNMSHASIAHDQSSVDTTTPPIPVDPASMATPVVMRKRKASGEMIPFSAHKKKAILQNLPQQATLANTPFTPSSAIKKLDINEMRRAGTLNTPNIAFSNKEKLAFSATPCQANKNTRKRLNLFSPGNGRKGKKLPSSSNISMSAANKKGKCKGLFRRLSGGKGDKNLPERPRSTQAKQVGQRLAVPTGVKAETIEKSNCKDAVLSHGNSPIRSIVDSSVLSPTLPEQSVLSVGEEDTNSLNEGFILQDEDGDVSHMSANISCMDSSEVPSRCLSDSAVNEVSRLETVEDYHQQSMPSIPNHQLQRRGTLRRGRPNSLKAGLLQGEKDNVVKLRRSFGLDKSDIGDPVPLYVPDTSGYVEIIQLGNSSQILTDKSKECSMDLSESSIDKGEKLQEKSQSNSVSSDASTINGNDSEAGFSTLSSETVTSDSKLEKNQDSLPEEICSKSYKINSHESTDSLLGSQTDNSPSSPQKEKKNFPRSISTDSGKGSMFEESGVLDSTDVKLKLETESKTIEQCKRDSEHCEPTTKSDSLVPDEIISSDRKLSRFVSTIDVKRKMTSSVSRSHSVHESSMLKKNSNHTPNLQISVDTHKLLSRAGYLSNKQDVSSSKEDITVMGPPQAILKHADTSIPKHESILELQSNLSGKVKNCVKSLETDVTDRHESPYRFPNSVSRKRGCSPVRIPTVFAKSEQEAAKIKDIVHVTQKLGKGQARLPISTQLLKPTETVATGQPQKRPTSQSCRLSRKPSIYYAKDNGKPCIASSDKLNSAEKKVQEPMDTSDTTLSQNKENKETSASDCRFTDTKAGDSHMETITEVCTPLRDSVDRNNSDDMDVTPTNAKLSKVPGIKMPILPGDLGERVLLRTTGGQTPHHIMRGSSKSPRSPIKPVKRLGSPGSPCRNTPRRHASSPGHRNRSRLTSIPHHLQSDLSSV